MANIAMLLERKVKCDPAKYEFVGDDEANALMSRTQRAVPDHRLIRGAAIGRVSVFRYPVPGGRFDSEAAAGRVAAARGRSGFPRPEPRAEPHMP